MPAGMVGSLLDLALITFAAVAAVWCVFNAGLLGTVAVRMGRAVHLVPAPQPAPLGMPIERIAADLRRIRPEALRPAVGMPMARRRGIVAAYDQALVEACQAVGVSTELGLLRDDLERECERLRAEHELARAGVDLG
jgi:hypothetical protein